MSNNEAKQRLGSVLVVGGCGFLGHHIVRQLASSGQASAIGVLDLRTDRNRLSSDDNDDDDDYGFGVEGDGRPRTAVRYFDGDISSVESIRPVFDEFQPDVVIHTASPTVMGTPRDVLYRVNVTGTKNLVEVAAGLKGRCKAFVYTSTSSVISDGKSSLVNADERWPYVPPELQEEYYAQTKAEAEMFVLAANRQEQYHGLLTVSIRPAGMIGEGDVQNVPNVLKAYREKRTRFQLGSNDNLFDFTYVGNAAHAHVLAATALMRTAARPGQTVPLEHERIDGEAFFVTNDSPVYFWDFPRLVWRAAGDTTRLEEVWCIPTQTGLVIASLLEAVMGLFGRKPAFTRQIVKYTAMTRYFNCRKARERLAYEPIVPVEEAVRRAVRWAQAQEEIKSKASSS